MVNRRQFLLTTGGAMGWVLWTDHQQQILAQPRFSAYPFSLGVASGDPDATSVVLWTRIAPDPLSGQPMPAVSIPVQWKIAVDAQMEQVVQQGTVQADPRWGHAVHVVVENLSPGQWYWYQFQVGETTSPMGRTRTLPAPGARIASLKFAYVSCQNYEHGFYTAYQHLAQEDLDLVLHLGDYIYEGDPRSSRPRQHVGPNPVDLATYRWRYALYKSDPQLQAAHAAFPFICIWDDHEVENDYAKDKSQDFADPAMFRQRRQAAYQAYYEHLPLRPTAQPQDQNLQLYRRFAFGDLAEFHCLDTRQYRDDQACDQNGKGGGQVVFNCEERLDPKRSLLGFEQERWLLQGLADASTKWTVIAQQMLMAELKQGVKSWVGHWSDGWDGYAATRDRIFEGIAQYQPANPVVIGGDIHSFWVTDLKADFQDPQSPVLATEFVGTSISSGGPNPDLFTLALKSNPHIKFFESRYRGYVVCKVTPDRWIAHFRVVDQVEEPGAPLRTLASFQIENGQPGAQRADGENQLPLDQQPADEG
ncbi:alkaline phosphatase D family protein [Acaryochloris sp. IP29b_bin.137]|uniref:alkaline phosphatase D family protein n=1 Tax=Acaryochloris sp. IP29b_bin.137 TaxID=2969217 RepID=UPI0026095749|nr:alkaline phosphatase D family protein [Acaryochloris sp. IP29b_bin.137]